MSLFTDLCAYPCAKPYKRQRLGIMFKEIEPEKALKLEPEKALFVVVVVVVVVMCDLFWFTDSVLIHVPSSISGSVLVFFVRSLILKRL